MPLQNTLHVLLHTFMQWCSGNKISGGYSKFETESLIIESLVILYYNGYNRVGIELRLIIYHCEL